MGVVTYQLFSPSGDDGDTVIEVTSGARSHPEEFGRPGGTGILSANSVATYVRPLRSLAIWLGDEGYLGLDPFRRSRSRTALNPLLPREEAPTNTPRSRTSECSSGAAPAPRRSICATERSSRSS